MLNWSIEAENQRIVVDLTAVHRSVYQELTKSHKCHLAGELWMIISMFGTLEIKTEACTCQEALNKTNHEWTKGTHRTIRWFGVWYAVSVQSQRIPNITASRPSIPYAGLAYGTLVGGFDRFLDEFLRGFRGSFQWQEVALAGAKGFASSLAWVVPIPLSDYETSSSATALALRCRVN
ncbi:hypothetical protein L1987_04751 [Smallanthus sonchifolius]|uniref:Uncharacterized protein n=1 Tax=Smallanthus sonchifolius TaxID=185202 RepID=A0ACB9JTF2_9ASTR|nr:hypothetical protein L1987_04751 [Smallanthus sonchifolius]